jgi:hypothetical protein
MNDIDLRCDSYLAWLDDKRRSREPILKELLALSGATAGILKATNAGAKSLPIAAIAFSLASDTFTVASNRLVTTIDQNTVQTVVLDNQLTYRKQVLRQKIDNKPAALYILRGYLRICMPFAIEMSITNTLAVYHRAGPEALLNNPPLVTQVPLATFRSSMVITNPTRPLPDFRPPRGNTRPATPTSAAQTVFGDFEQRLKERLPGDIRMARWVLFASPRWNGMRIVPIPNSGSTTRLLTSRTGGRNALFSR